MVGAARPRDWSQHADLLRGAGRGPPWREGECTDLLDELEDLSSLPLRQALVRRVVHLRQPEMSKLQDDAYMKLHDYSVLASALGEDLPYSGRGAERGYIVWIYYAPQREARVLMALQTIGVNLGGSPPAAVDINDCTDFEQEILYSAEAMLQWDKREHSVHEEISLDGYRYFPWAGRLIKEGT
eukprot:TRINITY_DN82971_c0_g1_i1.p1 TRINITY_DN82971_c0_g1~~TRINITY_DN82971_c0_g1_i1.p1  ORF type:complete len:184 (-),score=37.41 TRINITY_DN82971_c0_g1_i1:60-611(-)